MKGWHRTKRVFGRMGLYLLVSAIAFFCLFPFYYAIVTSLRTGTELFSTGLWPRSASLRNYRDLFAGAEQSFLRSILNSLAVSCAVVMASLSLGVTASYALGRIHFRGRGLLLLTVLAVSMFPQVAVLSGMFELMRAIGFYNHWWGLTLPYMIFTLPFTVWGADHFRARTPEGAGRGGHHGRLFTSGHHRQGLPARDVACPRDTGLLAFIAAWNEFMFALTFVLDNSQRTVPVVISLLSGADRFEIPWGKIMAASVLVTLPLVGLVLVFQRKIVGGLTSGAVKG